MTSVGMHEAKTHLSRLVAEVESGGSVTITRNGEPVAELVRVRTDASTDCGFGAMEGRGTVTDLSLERIRAGDVEIVDMFFGSDG